MLKLLKKDQLIYKDIAINHFITDTDKEVELIQDHCSKLDVQVNLCTHWSDGGKGTVDLAKSVVEIQ